jgi:hypothetical protein
MEKFIEKVATENANTIIDAMVKNYINDFWGKPENELDLAKVNSYLEFVRELNYTTHRDFENHLLAIMTANLHQISAYMNTLYNWEIMPMADDEDLKMAFEDRVSDCMFYIKSAIKTYVTKRDKFIEGVANK